MPKSLLWLACAFAAARLGFSSRAVEVISFPAGDGGWQLGTLAVGNLDNSGQLSIVVPYRNSNGQWLLDAYKPNGTRLPGFPYVGNHRAGNCRGKNRIRRQVRNERAAVRPIKSVRDRHVTAVGNVVQPIHLVGPEQRTIAAQRNHVRAAREKNFIATVAIEIVERR